MLRRIRNLDRLVGVHHHNRSGGRNRIRDVAANRVENDLNFDFVVGLWDFGVRKIQSCLGRRFQDIRQTLKNLRWGPDGVMTGRFVSKNEGCLRVEVEKVVEFCGVEQKYVYRMQRGRNLRVPGTHGGILSRIFG